MTRVIRRRILTTKKSLANSLFLSGTGYIGSFTTLALLEHGYDVIIVDSLYNSSEVALDRIELICGRRPAFYKLDITDEKAIDEVFAKHPEIDSVIHFAALKASNMSNVAVYLRLTPSRLSASLA